MVNQPVNSVGRITEAAMKIIDSKRMSGNKRVIDGQNAARVKSNEWP